MQLTDWPVELLDALAQRIEDDDLVALACTCSTVRAALTRALHKLNERRLRLFLVCWAAKRLSTPDADQIAIHGVPCRLISSLCLPRASIDAVISDLLGSLKLKLHEARFSEEGSPFEGGVRLATLSVRTIPENGMYDWWFPKALELLLSDGYIAHVYDQPQRTQTALRGFHIRRNGNRLELHLPESALWAVHKWTPPMAPLDWTSSEESSSSLEEDSLGSAEEFCEGEFEAIYCELYDERDRALKGFSPRYRVTDVMRCLGRHIRNLKQMKKDWMRGLPD